jgi:hypothetical protein
MRLDSPAVPRLVWFVLKDGRSVVAGCGSTPADLFEAAMHDPGRMLTLTSDDRVDELPGSAIRDFVVVDAPGSVPPASAIYRLVRVGTC